MTPIRLFVVVLALVLSACGQSRSVESTAPATAATVSGPSGESEVAREELEAIVTSVTDSERFVSAVFNDALPPNFRQTVLTQMIHVQALEGLLEEEGGEVTAEDRAEIQGLLTEELTGLLAQTGSDADTEELLAEIDPYTQLLVERNALLTAVGRSLTEGTEAQTQDVVCAGHILVEDEAVANDLLAQLQGGADFATLAQENSTDPGSGAQGGDLGCAPPDQYVPEFAEAVSAAPLDEVVGPVQTDFGYHLITVYERRTEEVPVDTVGAAGTALTQRLQELEVEVSNDLGRWDTETLSVVEAGAPAADGGNAESTEG